MVRIKKGTCPSLSIHLSLFISAEVFAAADWASSNKYREVLLAQATDTGLSRIQDSCVRMNETNHRCYRR